MSTFKAIPTNVITGFLGVGKTTAILNLLKQKPDDERWAVLVNEFGEVGIDGSLLHGKDRVEQGIYIKEVPGGCMCCAAGLSMHIALNMLIAHAKPHRLIIEPTGLGHPKEVLDILSSELCVGTRQSSLLTPSSIEFSNISFSLCSWCRVSLV